MRQRFLCAISACLLVIATCGSDQPAAAQTDYTATVSPQVDSPLLVDDVAEGAGAFSALVLAPSTSDAIDAWLAADLVVREEAWYAAEREAWYQAERDAAAAEKAAAEARARAVVPKPPKPAIPDSIWQIINDAAVRWGIDPALFARIAGCESGGNPNAYNSSGASGLFQHLRVYWPGRAAAAGIPGADVFDPWANAEVSARMIALGGTSPWNASKHCWAAW